MFSRRALLVGGAEVLAVSAVAVPLALRDGGGPVTDLDRWFQPVAAADVLAGTGVAAHPTFLASAYRDADAWMSRLVQCGVRIFRGRYDPRNPGCTATVEACRRYGVSWIMLVVPEGTTVPTEATVAQTVAVVRDIAHRCPDVCVAIEGLNEPDHNRSSAPAPDNWATAYAAPHQRAIWETVHATPTLRHVSVIGPSLHDASAMSSYSLADPSGGPNHFEQLAHAGVGDWQDWAGLHSYPNGGPPLTGLAERLTRVRDAFGPATRIHVTETGYQNAVGEPAALGTLPASEQATATYIDRTVLQLAELGVRGVWYELLDDPDPGGPGGKAVPESNFGLWRVGSVDPATWTGKPAVARLRALMDSLREPAGAAYTPTPVRLRIRSEAPVSCVVTARRDGTAAAHLFRELPVWDPRTRTPDFVASADVVVGDAAGDRSIRVGADLVSLVLR